MSQVSDLRADLDRDPCELVDRWLLSAPDRELGPLEARSIAKHTALAATVAETERKVAAIFCATSARSDLERLRDQLMSDLELALASLREHRGRRPMFAPLTPAERVAQAAERGLRREFESVMAALAIQDESRWEVMLALDVAQGGDGEGI